MVAKENKIFILGVENVMSPKDFAELGKQVKVFSEATRTKLILINKKLTPIETKKDLNKFLKENGKTKDNQS